MSQKKKKKNQEKSDNFKNQNNTNFNLAFVIENWEKEQMHFKVSSGTQAVYFYFDQINARDNMGSLVDICKNTSSEAKRW